MRSKIAAFAIGSMLACSAHAASWNLIRPIGGERSLFFFDWDTVAKRPNGLTIWIKSVNSESTPDKDGSYATAIKYNIDCNKHTLQALAMVTYDRSQVPMQTITSPASPFEAVPGTVGEALVQVTCDKSFPSKQATDYFPVANNDILAFTRTYFSLKNDPAPK